MYKRQDIGISVDGGVDIAKEAADIILLERSLMVLEEGVIEGRKTFSNMLKYIRMAASSNFGNVFSVLIASIFPVSYTHLSSTPRPAWFADAVGHLGARAERC